MPTPYLAPAEYAAWGLPVASSTDALVLRASSMIDGWCHRAIGVSAYRERLTLPEGRNQALLTYGPFVAWDTTQPGIATGARGRYGYGRRGDAERPVDLMGLVSFFGGPPEWSDIPTSQVDVDHATGAIWLPLGIYQTTWSDVEVAYTAGYATIPDDVKMATATIALALGNAQPGVRSLKAGDRQVEYQPGMAGAIPLEAQAMLERYRVRKLA